MCGIIGYVGNRNASGIIVDSLKKLEYRGYDSCGIATINKSSLVVKKTINGVEDLSSMIQEDFYSNIGIGHTRWATHGGASVKNAHPHLSNDKKIAVVHNGIIENYLELRKMLINKGFSFYSDTDTEIIPNLISLFYNGDILTAVKEATNMLIGSFSICVLCTLEPQKIIVSKNKSPLVIGFGNGENFISSDFSAISKYSYKFGMLKDKQFAVVTKDTVCFYDNDLKAVSNDIKDNDFSYEDIDKNGYGYYMLKEIYESCDVLNKTIIEYINIDNSIRLDFLKDKLKNVKHIHIVACGTAMHAGLNGKFIIEKLTRIPVDVEIASEFRYADPIFYDDDFVIFISQSGETADTIACLELVKKNNIKHLSIVNVKNSTIDLLSDNVIYTMAGAEIAVASTKAYIAQVALMDILAIYLATLNNSYDSLKLKELINELKTLPSKVNTILNDDEIYLEYAKKIVNENDIYYFGRGIDYYTSLEASLKLKEVSYIHSEALPFGEIKHGSIALIESDTHIITFLNSKDLLEKSINNAKEVKARGAIILAVSSLEDLPNDVFNDIISIPKVSELLSPILAIVPMQLVAYHVAVLKKLNVDKPRNLAKSVTVE